MGISDLMLPAIQTAGDSQGTITQIFMGCAALVGAFTAYRVAKRDNNASELQETRGELTTAKKRVDDLENDLIDMRKYIFQVRAEFANHGINTPPPPVLRSEHT